MMDEELLKKAFGIELARNPGEPFQAALSIFGDDTGKALMASQVWVRDPLVIQSRDEYLAENGVEVKLDSKAELAAKILKFADEKNADETRYLHDGKDRLSAYKLYAEVMGYIEKPQVVNNNNVVATSNKVMVVQNFGDDDNWEQALAAQQRQLVHDARH